MEVVRKYKLIFFVFKKDLIIRVYAKIKIVLRLFFYKEALRKINLLQSMLTLGTNISWDKVREKKDTLQFYLQNVHFYLDVIVNSFYKKSVGN